MDKASYPLRSDTKVGHAILIYKTFWVPIVGFGIIILGTIKLLYTARYLKQFFKVSTELVNILQKYLKILGRQH